MSSHCELYTWQNGRMWFLQPLTRALTSLMTTASSQWSLSNTVTLAIQFWCMNLRSSETQTDHGSQCWHRKPWSDRECTGHSRYTRTSHGIVGDASFLHIPTLAKNSGAPVLKKWQLPRSGILSPVLLSRTWWSQPQRKRKWLWVSTVPVLHSWNMKTLLPIHEHWKLAGGGRGGRGRDSREGRRGERDKRRAALSVRQSLRFYGGKALVMNPVRNEKFSVITQILENSSGRSKETWL